MPLTWISDPENFDAHGNPAVLPGQRLGTLFGEDAEKAIFNVKSGVPLPFGSLCKAVELVRLPNGTVGQIRHILQVYDVRYASDGRGEFLQMQARELDLYRDLSVHNEESQRHLQGLESSVHEMMYNVAHAYKLGYLDVNGVFHERSYLPPVNLDVYMVDEEDLRLLEPHLGEIPIGNVLIGKTRSSIKAGFFHKFMSYHTFSTARTGWGKTYFLMVALHQLAVSGRYGGIIFDGQGDIMQKLLDSPIAREKYRFFSNDPQYRGNPMVRRWKVSRGEVRPSHIEEVFGVSDAQRLALPILRRAFYQMRDAAMERPHEFERYLNDIAQYGDTFGLGWSWITWINETSKETLRNGAMVPALRGINEMTVDALKVKVASLCSFQMLTDDPNGCSLHRFYEEMSAGKFVIVDTTTLLDQEARLLIAMVGSKMLREQEDKRKRTPLSEFEQTPTLVLFLDEAHEHLGEGQSTSCTQIAKTGRKFKVSLFAVTQQPSDISRRIRSQFNNLVIGPQPLELDREASISMASHPLKHLSHMLQVGEQGEGILTAAGLPFAVPIKILDYNQLIEEYRRQMTTDQRIQTRTRRQTEGFAG